MAVPTLVGLAAGGALGSVLMGEFAAPAFAALLVTSLLFVMTYISVVVGLSALTGSTSRASMLTIGFFVVFEFMWGAVSYGVVWLTNGFALPPLSEFPNWVFLVNQVPPSAAFTTGLTAFIPGDISGVAGPDFEAFYATPWVGIVMLVFWLVVPLAIGYWRFSNADL
ncbi:hypothetical protein Hrd1104_08370 [Halorhabdus sp. CBA1104]|nr:hypothetical protein Hrd1104_08370 [Halorhabdus sp. CBA1104]